MMKQTRYVFTGFIRKGSKGSIERVMAKADCYLCGGKGRFVHHRGVKRKMVNRHCWRWIFIGDIQCARSKARK